MSTTLGALLLHVVICFNQFPTLGDVAKATVFVVQANLSMVAVVVANPIPLPLRLCMLFAIVVGIHNTRPTIARFHDVIEACTKAMSAMQISPTIVVTPQFSPKNGLNLDVTIWKAILWTTSVQTLQKLISTFK